MNVFNLKLIALITMIIDHVGVVFFPGYSIFRCIGRFAFPIYSFLVSEGCKKTKNFSKYLIRLLVFALISEVFFDLAFQGKVFYINYNNTIFTLFFASLTIFILTRLNVNLVVKIFFIFLIFLILNNFGFDYGLWGVLLTLTFYFYENRALQIISAFILICINGLGFVYTIFNLIPLIFIAIYNENKGKDFKIFNISFFYWAYPLHLFVIYLIKILR